MTVSPSSAPPALPVRRLPLGVLPLIVLIAAGAPSTFFLLGPTAAVMLILALASVVAIRWPVAIPIAVIVLSPLLGQFEGDSVGPLNSIGALSLWFLVFGSAIVLFGYRTIQRERFLVIPLLLLAVTAASIVVSNHRAVTATEVVRATAATLMLPAVLVVGARYRDRIAIVAAMLVSSIIPLTVGYHQKLTGNMVLGGATLTEFELRTRLVRIYGTFFDVHPFAKYLMVVLLLLTALVVTVRRWPPIKLMYVSLFAAAFLALIFTYTRGQLISYLAGATAILLAGGKLRLRFLIVVLPLIAATFYYTGVVDRFEDIAPTASVEASGGAPRNSLERRFLIWRSVLPSLRHGLILGHGADTFQFEAGIIAHNDYLGVLYELGAGGLLLYMLFLGVAALRCWKARTLTGLPDLDRALILAGLGVSVAIGVGSIAENLYRSTAMWWFYMAILGGAFAVIASAQSVDRPIASPALQARPPSQETGSPC